MDYTKLIISLVFVLILFLLNFILKIFYKKSKNKFSIVIGIIIYWSIAFISMIYLFNLWESSYILNKTFFRLFDANITYLTIIISLFIIILSTQFSNVFSNKILPKILSKYDIDKSAQFTISRIVQYIIVIITLFIVITNLGIKLSSLTVFASLFGVGIGFGMQNIVSNFISGIILLFDRPVKVGDRILVSSELGDIVDIKIRYTVVKTLNNEHIIIPNSYFLNEKVKNQTYRDNLLRLALPVAISFDCDFDIVKKAILETANELINDDDRYLKTPKPIADFNRAEDSYFVFRLLIWIENAKDEVYLNSNANYKLYEKIRKYNIEVPYPQLDIHNK